MIDEKLLPKARRLARNRNAPVGVFEVDKDDFGREQITKLDTQYDQTDEGIAFDAKFVAVVMPNGAIMVE